MPKSNYYLIPELDLWTLERDAYKFEGDNPVICHPPCQQWSKLKKFAKENKKEKDLAFFCLEKVLKNGGILEHPVGSSFFKEAGISKGIYKIDQSVFGFPARKSTLLLFSKIKPLSYPLFSFPVKGVADLHSGQRSKMTLAFCQWLVDCVKQIDIPYGRT